MTTFNLALPDQGASKDTKTSVLSGKFGDGYEQRVGQGINNVAESWPLSFTARPKSVINAIDDFLRACFGVTAFYWTTPQGKLKKFKCSSWKATYNTDGDCSLTCTFEQVFEA